MRYLRLAALGEHLQQQVEQQPFALPLTLKHLIEPGALAALQQGFAAACETSDTLPLPYLRLVQELSSHGLLMRLERLTGLTRLLPDQQLISGGCRHRGVEVASIHPETGLRLALSLRIDLGQTSSTGDGLLYNTAVADDKPGFLMHYYYSPFSGRG
ncbi:MAG: hypothetical protein CSA53_01090 [Gammaproteobacteria bacterium]|nr:MAG: hypothetical protein CSA53_01090 [Gammaproteobacteria bacterium]